MAQRSVVLFAASSAGELYVSHMNQFTALSDGAIPYAASNAESPQRLLMKVIHNKQLWRSVTNL